MLIFAHWRAHSCCSLRPGVLTVSPRAPMGLLVSLLKTSIMCWPPDQSDCLACAPPYSSPILRFLAGGEASRFAGCSASTTGPSPDSGVTRRLRIPIRARLAAWTQRESPVHDMPSARRTTLGGVGPGPAEVTAEPRDQRRDRQLNGWGEAPTAQGAPEPNGLIAGIGEVHRRQLPGR